MVAIDDCLMFASEMLPDLPSMKVPFLPDASALQPQDGADPGLARKNRLFISVALFSRLSFDWFGRTGPLGFRIADGARWHHAGATDQNYRKLRPALYHS